MPRSALLNVMVTAARKAARKLNRDFGEVENLQVSVKGPSDFVTAADRKAEQVIVEELQKARPGYPILTEEAGFIPGTDKTHRWIIDPLDGTTNFMHGFPMFAISIALERDGVLEAALVYNPIAEELFTASRGAGAYLNDRRIRVAARSRLSDAIVTTGIPHSGRGDHDLALRELAAVMPRVAGIRRTGSAALDLAYVAAGRVDAFWEHGLSPWDIAGGLMLVREAGGLVSDTDNKDAMFETGSIIAGNESLRMDLYKLLKKAATATA